MKPLCIRRGVDVETAKQYGKSRHIIGCCFDDDIGLCSPIYVNVQADAADGRSPV